MSDFIEPPIEPPMPRLLPFKDEEWEHWKEQELEYWVELYSKQKESDEGKHVG